MKPISKLGIGPMSSEIIEAVFRYSSENKEPLMLIVSKNQIDWNGGYVNGWNTKEFSEFIRSLKRKNNNSQVYICRDHCGPGFNNIYDLEDTYKTIDSDIENDFDLIHVDFSNFKGSKEQILEESKKAINYILDKNSKIIIEAGTDENGGDFLEDVDSIKEEIDFFVNINSIEFFVVQTGSLIKEINQVGGFNESFIREVGEYAKKRGILLKEHNADYLDEEAIRQRSGLIGAMNVAPQFGVIQTQLTIQKCLSYGIDFSNFLDKSYKSKKWEKWLHNNGKENKFLCSIIAGHYVFSSLEYKEIYKKISKHENFEESIINEIMKTIDLYIKNLN